MRLKILVVILVVSLAGCSWMKSKSEGTSPDQANKKDIITFLTLSGIKQQTDQMMGMMMDMIFNAIKQNTLESNPKANEAEIDKDFDEIKVLFGEEFKASEDKFWDKMSGIYQEYLNQKDVDYLIEVYKNPTMKKLVASQDDMMMKGMQVGQEFGSEISQKVMSKMGEKAEGQEKK